MRILKRQLTIDEIEQEIINIRQEGGPKFLEDRRIQELLKSYYYDQRELKINSLSKTLVKNLIYILKKRNMTLKDLAGEISRKSGGLETVYRNKDLLTSEYYRCDNIMTFAIDFGFGLNINPWDLLFYDLEYLISKNMLSPF
jgi:hypothetical protein